MVEMQSDGLFGGSRNAVSQRVAKVEYPGIEPNEIVNGRIMELLLSPTLQQQAFGVKVRSYYYLNVRVNVPWGFDSKLKCKTASL